MVLFVDSFNHYDSLIKKWDFVNSGSIINNPAIARTGPRCVQVIGGSIAMTKNIGTGLKVIQYPKLIMGVAINSDGLPANRDIMHFTVVGAFLQDHNIIISLNTDGSFSAFKGAGDSGQTLLGSSAAGLFQFTTAGHNRWNFLECKVLISRTAGSVELRLATQDNGVGTGVMTVILSLTGVNTAAIAAGQYCNQIAVGAPGDIPQNSYLADFYLLDWSTTPNNTYLGGVKIYHDVPFANGAPIQFVPLAGTNWSEVNQVPPPGDTSYNSSGTIGQVDQYQHNLGTVPANGQIQAVQHVMDVRIDAGSRAITSQFGTYINPNSAYLSNNYSMLAATFPYDINPVTNLPWKLGDFPAQFGPLIVA